MDVTFIMHALDPENVIVENKNSIRYAFYLQRLSNLKQITHEQISPKLIHAMDKVFNMRLADQKSIMKSNYNFTYIYMQRKTS